MIAAIPIGDLADRHGPRGVVRGTLLVQCLVTLCYVFIHGFAAFLIVVCLEMLCFDAAQAANGPLLRRVGGENAAAYRSVTRAIGNLGTSLGAVGCAIALQIGTPVALRTLIIVNTATFLVSWAVLGRLPHYEPLPKPKEQTGRWIALRDKPFVTYAALAGALSMQYWVLFLPLPLWVVGHTHAPRWSVPTFLIINTVLVIFLQVRVGRNVKSAQQGGTALRRAGVIFLLSCAAIGLAAGLPGWAALLLLVAAVVVHTVGELFYAAGSFALDFGLAPEHAQGQYQGLVGIGFSTGAAVAPILMIGLVLSLGRSGWIGLGVLFALLGLAAPAVARWGERTRPAPVAAAEPAPVPEPAGAAVGD